MSTRAVALLGLLALAPPVAGAASHLLIVGGLGGEPYYSDLFHRWVQTLAEVARTRLRIAPERLIRLEEDPSRDASARSRSSHKAQVLAAIARLAEGAEPGDVVALVFIGHGATDGRQTMLNLPGPDLSGHELADAVNALAGMTVVVVVAAPASAPLLGPLAGPNRVVIAATASASEVEHTRFGGPFVSAFAEDTADTDKNGRVSVLEAFRYATAEVSRWYRLEGRLRTEHAVLDDDGDGVGSPKPGPGSSDGARAARVHLEPDTDETDSSSATARARLALQIDALRLVDRVEALKRRKAAFDESDYARRLEALLVELALNRRSLRTLAVP